MTWTRETVAGWTLASSHEADIAYPSHVEDLPKLLQHVRRQGKSVTLRGAGFSYADEITNRGGIIINLSRMNRILNWDPTNGQLTVEPGVNFEQALLRILPDGWIVPAVPGIKGVTMAGAVSNNVHGKNGWRAGNFGDAVISFTLLTSDGGQQTCTRANHPELFRAVIGGLGLLGILTQVTLQCQRIPSPYLRVRRYTVPNLSRLLETLAQERACSPYHIAWVDCYARGRFLGRGTMEVGEFIDAPAGRRADPLRPISTDLLGLIPRSRMWPVLRPFFGTLSVRALNTFKYHKDSLQTGRERIDNFLAFNYPLEKIPDWRQLFRPHGYHELEPIIPFEKCEAAFRRMIEMTQAYGHPSHLTAIKSHRADDFLLTYSSNGCSIGIDLPIRPSRQRELADLFQRMLEVVLEAGGKQYLAKDDILTAAQFRRMYPQWQTFHEIKKTYDPALLFQSDMYRRLFL
jgi:decaprenylphospho-beta-D-ribofuranose 2-oxidase